MPEALYNEVFIATLIVGTALQEIVNWHRHTEKRLGNLMKKLLDVKIP